MNFYWATGVKLSVPPGTVLRRVGEKPWVATINVDDEGNAEVIAR